MKLRQSDRVDLVGLDAGVGDRTYQSRVGDDDTSHVRPHEPFHGGAVAGCFNDNLILETERLGKGNERFLGKVETKLPRDRAVLQDRHLSEGSMDVHANDFHAVLSRLWEPVACTTSTDPRSQRSRASRRGGQVTTRALSSS